MQGGRELKNEKKNDDEEQEDGRSRNKDGNQPGDGCLCDRAVRRLHGRVSPDLAMRQQLLRSAVRGRADREGGRPAQRCRPQGVGRRRNERSAGRLARSRQSLEREAVGQRGPTTFDAGRFTTNAQPLTPAEQAAQARQRKHTTEPRPTSARFNSPSTGDEAPKEAGKKKKKKKPTDSDG